MNTSGEAADQIVKLSLNGVEVTAKILGAGSKELAVLLYSILKNQKRTKGKVRLESLIHSGKPLQVFSVNKNDLQQFVREAKRYGVLYCALRDSKSKDGITDILVKEEDAPKINRIIERFKFATVKEEKEDTSSQAEQSEKSEQSTNREENKSRNNVSVKEEDTPLNPSPARTVKPPPSEPILKMQDRADRGINNKPSVREKLHDIRFAKQQDNKNSPVLSLQNKQPQVRKKVKEKTRHEAR